MLRLVLCPKVDVRWGHGLLWIWAIVSLALALAELFYARGAVHRTKRTVRCLFMLPRLLLISLHARDIVAVVWMVTLVVREVQGHDGGGGEWWHVFPVLIACCAGNNTLF